MNDKLTQPPPILTLPNAAKMAGMSRRGLLRWLKARMYLEPSVLQKAEGERVWYVQRDALRRLLGAPEEHVLSILELHDSQLLQLEKRMRVVEHSVVGPRHQPSART